MRAAVCRCVGQAKPDAPDASLDAWKAASGHQMRSSMSRNHVSLQVLPCKNRQMVYREQACLSQLRLTRMAIADETLTTCKALACSVGGNTAGLKPGSALAKVTERLGSAAKNRRSSAFVQENVQIRAGTQHHGASKAAISVTSRARQAKPAAFSSICLHRWQGYRQLRSSR